MKQAVRKPSGQYPHIVSVVLVAWASIGPVGSILARSHTAKNQPVIRVAVYNYADVALRELQVAERQAGGLFSKAGVNVAWLDYSRKLLLIRSQFDDSLPHFSVRILYASKRGRAWWFSEADTLGQAIIPSGTEGPVQGGIANVFYGHVVKISSEWGPFSGDMLGEAIAHELGHLLLGPRHSAKGIMKATWSLQDEYFASRGYLEFLPAQRPLLQRAARSLQKMVYLQSPPSADSGCCWPGTQGQSSLQDPQCMHHPEP